MGTAPTFFLLFRRGIPVIGVMLSMAAILLYPNTLGWVLIVCIALMADLATTFFAGDFYLAKRRALLAGDGHWLQALRPLFGAFGFEGRWLQSFCAWNNRRVSHAFSAKKAQRVVVLLPHCVQTTGCGAPVVENIQSCFRCGKCVVGGAARTALECSWDIRLSPRSRAAYSEARKSRPDMVIAVACPDRLVKGLIRLPEIPSYVIPLDLPHGMCVDTTFDFQRLAQVMGAFADTRHAPRIQPLKISGQ
jgi:hypothetical protein